MVVAGRRSDCKAQQEPEPVEPAFTQIEIEEMRLRLRKVNQTRPHAGDQRRRDPPDPGAADDRVTTYDYNAFGEQLLNVTKPGGRTTSYDYYLNLVTSPLAIRFALLSVTYPDGTHDFFNYDGLGRLTETSADGGAQRVTYGYDSAGTVTVTEATGRQTILKYGLGGQLAQARDGEDRIVNFAYNTNSQLSRLTGSGGEKYRYGYEPRGNLASIQDPLGLVNSFAFEPNFNHLNQVTDARQNGLQYAYDTRGNLSRITYPDSTREAFGYDAVGNLTTSTNRRGQVINYTYNSASQLTSKDYTATPGGAHLSFLQG